MYLYERNRDYVAAQQPASTINSSEIDTAELQRALVKAVSI